MLSLSLGFADHGHGELTKIQFFNGGNLPAFAVGAQVGSLLEWTISMSWSVIN